MLDIILHVLVTGHYLFEPACDPGQSWQFIEEAGIYACERG